MKNSSFDWHKRLRQVRKQRGLNQGELAKLCGLSQATVSQYETGDRQGTIEGLGILLDGLKITFADFFCNCSTHKRRSDPEDFNPYALRRKNFQVVKTKLIIKTER